MLRLRPATLSGCKRFTAPIVIESNERFSHDALRQHDFHPQVVQGVHHFHGGSSICD